MQSKAGQESPMASKAINSGQAQHLRSIDRKIRKKWNLLYCYRKGRIGQLDPASVGIHKLNTEPAYSPKQQPLQLQHLKSNHHREATSIRIKKN